MPLVFLILYLIKKILSFLLALVKENTPKKPTLNLDVSECTFLTKSQAADLVTVANTFMSSLCVHV